MPIYLDGPVIQRGLALEQFETPFRTYMKAKFDEQMDNNITPLLREDYRVRAAGTVPVETEPDLFSLEYGAGPMRAPAPRMSAEAARLKVKDANLNINIPDDGIPEQALDILMTRKHRQRAYEDAINRSPTGMRSIAGVGVSLAAGVLDPLNLAAAFVPVVGPARYSLMLAKAGGAMGRAGVRASVGAMEGIAGMAILEPAAYAAHQGLQDDYTALDSIINIGFGGLLGGGLHVAGGAFRDVLGGSRRWARADVVMPDVISEPVSIRSTVLDEDPSAVNKWLETPTESRGLLSTIRSLGGITSEAGTLRDITGETRVGRGTRGIPPGLFHKGGRGLDELATQLRERGYIIDDSADGGVQTLKDMIRDEIQGVRRHYSAFDEETAFAAMRDRRMMSERDWLEAQAGARGVTPEPADVDVSNVDAIARASEIDEARVERAAIQFDNDETAFMAEIRSILDDARKQRQSQRREQGGKDVSGREATAGATQGSPTAQEVITRVTPAQREAALRTAIAQSADGRVVEVTPLIDPTANLGDALRRQASPDAERLSDPEVSQAADATIAAAPKSLDLKTAQAEADKALAQVEELWQATGRNPEELRALMPGLDEMTNQADSLARAARAAALCDL